ncbi:discoidin domain-containing protein [Lysinibacillus sp. NPDC092081]|uniref:discoidin domain-containing protein n=1 Tax=Lysinibacillus sp. NPDC092081 TaxID=3364131 RepID=UPI0037FFEE45
MNSKTYSLELLDVTYETKMTSNTAPSPLVVSASSEFNSNYLAWKAFNGTNNGSYDYYSSAIGTTGWIQIKYDKKVHANIVELSAFKDTQQLANGMPKDFNILGSNDGTNFVRLAELRNQTWINGETKKYKFRNSNEYQYYRIEALSTNGYEYICIGEILFKSNKSNFIEIQKTSANNFINYGAFKFEKLNSIFEYKSYILQDEISKNKEGLLTTKLDRKPLSISVN